jgi:hypothetical protein
MNTTSNAAILQATKITPRDLFESKQLDDDILSKKPYLAAGTET